MTPAELMPSSGDAPRIDLLAGRAHPLDGEGGHLAARHRVRFGARRAHRHDAIVRARPDADILYVADDAGFPYGGREEGELRERIVDLFARLLAACPADCVVIACNTASTLVLPALRARFATPFVGTVPAIKPAAERSVSGLISVLATPATVARDYTQTLIREYAGDCEVTLVGSARSPPARRPGCAGARSRRGDHRRDRAVLRRARRRRGPRALHRRGDAVLHALPLLLPRLKALAPWPVTWLDPAPAIARRVLELMGPPVPGVRAEQGWRCSPVRSGGPCASGAAPARGARAPRAGATSCWPDLSFSASPSLTSRAACGFKPARRAGQQWPAWLFPHPRT